MKPKYLVLGFVGTFLIVVILIWRRLRAIDRWFERMQREINELRWIESRLFLMGVNARPTGAGTEVELRVPGMVISRSR
jgi:hypothetical protein